MEDLRRDLLCRCFLDISGSRVCSLSRAFAVIVSEIEFTFFEDQRRVLNENGQGCRLGSTGASWPALAAQLKRVEL